MQAVAPVGGHLLSAVLAVPLTSRYCLWDVPGRLFPGLRPGRWHCLPTAVWMDGSALCPRVGVSVSVSEAHFVSHVGNLPSGSHAVFLYCLLKALAVSMCTALF